MKVRINRFKEDKNYIEEFITTKQFALSVLIDIKENIDSSLSFRCGCKSGVCGSCAIRINGVEVLACKTILDDNDLIEPIKNTKVIKDLVVDFSRETQKLTSVLSNIDTKINEEINVQDINLIDIQSNCILCNSCYSSCPVLEVNKEFLGPFILTKALRYIKDKKNTSDFKIIKSIQTNGIWDCTLCSACTIVCPQTIDPKSDIMQLQNISVQNGFSNPNFNNFDMSFDSNDFGGFNPNGF